VARRGDAPRYAGARHLPRRAAHRESARGRGETGRHSDVFDLPEGATHLARSAQTEVQAFRHGNAWGVLFHPEADFALVEAWLATPEMLREARQALGDGGAAALPEEVDLTEPDLIERTTPGLRAFAALAKANHRST